MAEEKNDGGSILDDDTAAKLLQEINQGYREWEYEGKTYRTRFPNAAEDAKARTTYAKSFNQNLQEGLLTTKQMMKLLTSRGIWDEDDEKTVSELRDKIAKLEALLAKKEPKDRSKATRKMVEELAAARVELFEKTSSYQDYMNQTVESLADESKTAFLISTCTVKDDGSPVWNSVDVFLNSTESGLVGTATFQFVTFVNGLAENYIEELTEVKFLRAGLMEDGSKDESKDAEETPGE